LFLIQEVIPRTFMSDIIRLNSNSKRLRVKESNSAFGEFASDEPGEEDYIQTNLQNYYDKGFNDGKEIAETEIKKEYETRFDNEANKISSILFKLHEQTVGYEKIFENLVAKLAFMISEKVIRSELSNKSNIEETIQSSLKKVMGSNNIIIKLNPDDLKVINEKANMFVQNGNLSRVKFEPDNSIEVGGCYVETEIGNVDARISTQITELQKHFEENL